MVKYRKELTEKICSLIKKDTYSNSQICAMTGIAERTFYRWQIKYTTFAQSIKEAYESRDSSLLQDARNSLRKKINGYTISESKITYEPDENGLEKIKNKVVNEKYYAPDTSAILFTLTNKDSQNWKNRPNSDSIDNNKQDLTIHVVSEQAKLDLEKLTETLNKDSHP